MSGIVVGRLREQRRERSGFIELACRQIHDAGIRQQPGRDHPRAHHGAQNRVSRRQPRFQRLKMRAKGS
jgi:hypothetical protein